MPLLNTSKTVLKRVKCLLAALIKFANNELSDCEDLIDKVVVRWKDTESGYPKLIVQTTLIDLEALTLLAGEKVSKKSIPEALKGLEAFLGIYEDNRAKTQGSENWNFTLTLFGKSVSRNLEAVEKAWNDRKSGRRSSSPSYQDLDLDCVVCHNLPARFHSNFIGKKFELNRLSALISPNNSGTSLVWIQGAGGVGKTTLALEFAYRCLYSSERTDKFTKYPQFTVIIFISAQSQRFFGLEFFERLNPDRTLGDIFRTILKTLNSEKMLPSKLSEQLQLVQDSLRRQKTLLILDNLETLDADLPKIVAFLGDLPSSVKTIVTSRRKICLWMFCYLWKVYRRLMA